MPTINVLPWALGRLIAEQRGDTSADASRLALPSLIIQPPMLAMLFAILEARRYSPPAKPVSTSGGSSSSQSGSSGSSSSGSSSSGSSSSASSSSASSSSLSGSSSSSSSSSRSAHHHHGPDKDAATQRLARGSQVLEGVGLGKRAHEFFPSFLGYTYKQAADAARLLKITVEPPEEQDGRVALQSPLPGEDWPRTVTSVQLRFI